MQGKQNIIARRMIPIAFSGFVSLFPERLREAVTPITVPMFLLYFSDSEYYWYFDGVGWGWGSRLPLAARRIFVALGISGHRKGHRDCFYMWEGWGGVGGISCLLWDGKRKTMYKWRQFPSSIDSSIFHRLQFCSSHRMSSQDVSNDPYLIAISTDRFDGSGELNEPSVASISLWYFVLSWYFYSLPSPRELYQSTSLVVFVQGVLKKNVTFMSFCSNNCFIVHYRH